MCNAIKRNSNKGENVRGNQQPDGGAGTKGEPDGGPGSNAGASGRI